LNVTTFIVDVSVSDTGQAFNLKGQCYIDFNKILDQIMN